MIRGSGGTLGDGSVGEEEVAVNLEEDEEMAGEDRLRVCLDTPDSSKLSITSKSNRNIKYSK